ncbi:IclR family transcriptional regulator [Sphingomonas sp. GB1N7]|uniref:IclR family transcriptional regulator n=1 Tax=Parasphingomonas caseinilytica TaxID=3096158 RepID=UPI002FCCA5A8
MATDGTSASVKSAIRTLDILEFLVAQRRPMAARELSVALAIPVSSLSYLLTTLVDRGYLARDGRCYAPGPALKRLQPATAVGEFLDSVGGVAKSLRDQLNESVAFFVRREFEVEAVVSAVGTQALRYSFDIGRRAPLHIISAGKAILAALPKDELDAYFRDSRRAAFTPNTLTDESPLRANLNLARASGIARTREEQTMGIVGIGRAVVVGGELMGAISVAIPLARFDAVLDRRVTELLMHATDQLASEVRTANGQKPNVPE